MRFRIWKKKASPPSPHHRCFCTDIITHFRGVMGLRVMACFSLVRNGNYFVHTFSKCDSEFGKKRHHPHHPITAVFVFSLFLLFLLFLLAWLSEPEPDKQHTTTTTTTQYIIVVIIFIHKGDGWWVWVPVTSHNQKKKRFSDYKLNSISRGSENKS